QLLIQGSGGDSLSCLQRLDTIMIGGEAFPLQLLETLKPLTSARIYNMYGPTETTVWSTVAELTNTNDITVGRPIANTSIYILDSHLNPQPVNVAGDLWIGGDGLAAGYLNRPEMTNDRFQTVKTKLYNTGDMARWLEDGNIEFIGRVDNQVKIRGFRVELGEIESQLLTHPEIDAAVVTTIGDALAAYIVSSRQMELPELRDHITQQLPDYMVPQYFVPIDSIPITPQGKLDRRALPTPEIKAGEDYIAPSGHEEETLVEIWSEVLDIDKSAIGVDTNFFDLGGHSLRATVVLSRVHKALEINVPLGEMFKTPTIKGLVNYIKQAGKETFISIPIAEKKEYFPLSPAQKRMYMLQQMEPDSKSYNMPLAVFLEGDTGKEKLEAVLLRLIRRHESFRTSFIVTDGMQVMQKIHDMEDVDFEVEIHHLEPTDSDREDKAVNDTFPNSRTDNVIQRFMRPFDLARAPLIRVGLVQLKDRHFLLMLDNHHIISDGTSFGLFIGEFMQLYAGKELPHLRIQYKDYSQWKNSEEGRKSNQSQETFWLSQWQGDIPVVNLPSDFPRPDMQSIAGSTFNFFIESGDHTRLKEVANSEGSSMFVLLLSIFNILINKMTGLDDIPVGTQIAGRRHSDLENIIGLFLNTLVLKNKLDNEDTFTGYLEQMTESTLKNFENQEYQFEDLSEKILGTRKVNRNPLFDVMFIWQNMEMNAMDVPELTLTPYGGGLKSSSLIDLSLYGFDRGEFIFFYFEYSTALFKEETIQRFATYFKDIVSAVVTDEKTLLKDIKISHDLGNIKTDLSDEMEDDFDF
ncbi:MAG: AMP-binding protein, partial [bacterium]|nr:AMP-binding protein [bacterium]